MSWFSELTSKAEAMLVKLDQDAAQALQNPDKLLKNMGKYDNERLSDSAMVDSYESEAETANSHHDHINLIHEDKPYYVDDEELSQPQASPSQNNVTSVEHSSGLTQQVSSIVRGNPEVSEHETVPDASTRPKATRYSKRFEIRASKDSARTFFSPPIASNKHKSSSTLTSDMMKMNGLHADDIRASINRTLQKCSIQHNPRTESGSNIPDQTPSTSHFDTQTNLVTSSSSLERSNTTRINTSESFSIDLPDDQSLSGKSYGNDIATRLLRQSASKKRQSTFYLHKVINKLANPRGQTGAIFGDQMKIKYRRAHLRLTSYARRLNYYFRTYPMMKYLMLSYLVFMQILVVYVLFFYQSSSSSSDLSSQIKQQQDGLIGSQSYSEKEPLLNNHLI